MHTIGTMGYEYDNAWKKDDTKMFALKVKSGVKDTSLSVGQDVVKDGKGGYNCKHKSELKTKLNSEWDAKIVSSNKEHEMDLEWKPTDLNKDGQKVELGIEAKCQPIPNTWSGELQLKAGGFELGPIKPWTTLKFATNDKLAHTLEYTQNLVYDKDFNLAWQLNLN